MRDFVAPELRDDDDQAQETVMRMRDFIIDDQDESGLFRSLNAADRHAAQLRDAIEKLTGLKIGQVLGSVGDDEADQVQAMLDSTAAALQRAAKPLIP